jgi:hypothetical protein
MANNLPAGVAEIAVIRYKDKPVLMYRLTGSVTWRSA